jgi:hypothetical protein
MRILLTACVLVFTISFSVSALPPPEKDEMTIGELEGQIYNLDGKVIETEVTYASSFEQIAQGKYRAWLGYYKGTGFSSSEYVLIPEEGREFAEELAEKDTFGGGSTETVYLLVHSKKPLTVKGPRYTTSFELEAVGTRFKKSKGIYTW